MEIKHCTYNPEAEDLIQKLKAKDFYSRLLESMNPWLSSI
jgi:hypothetical protein